jgi:hypothetical protein
MREDEDAGLGLAAPQRLVGLANLISDRLALFWSR